TEVAQRLDDRAHGALTRLRVAVEGHRAVGERGQRRHEPHDGPGETAVDLGRPAQARGVDEEVGAVGVRTPVRVDVLDADTEGAEGVDHEGRVARVQG